MWVWVRVCMRTMYNKLLQQTFLQSLHTLLICAKAPCLVGDSTALCEARKVKARRVPLPPPMVPLWNVPVPEGFPSLIMLQAIVIAGGGLSGEWMCPEPEVTAAMDSNITCNGKTDHVRDVNGFFSVLKFIVNLNEIEFYCQIVLPQRIQVWKTGKNFVFHLSIHCGSSWNCLSNCTLKFLQTILWKQFSFVRFNSWRKVGRVDQDIHCFLLCKSLAEWTSHHGTFVDIQK